jgi:hypothetical protein
VPKALFTNAPLINCLHGQLDFTGNVEAEAIKIEQGLVSNNWK